ncbi:MAG: hypothetical protein AAFP13_14455 [Pseudomonadota bacterium]
MKILAFTFAALLALALSALPGHAHGRITLVQKSEAGTTVILRKRPARHFAHRTHRTHRALRKPRVIVVPPRGGPVLVPRGEPFVLVSDPAALRPASRAKRIVLVPRRSRVILRHR